jgi:3-oxoacyl-[acyl-carrier protein] reductase
MPSSSLLRSAGARRGRRAVPITNAASDTAVGIVTGGASGIGWAVTERLCREGWSIVIFDIDEELGRMRLGQGSGSGSISFRPVDVRDRAAVERDVEAVWRQWGRLDLLVNNAGIQLHSPLDALDWAVWQQVLDVDLNGAAHCLRAAGRVMLEAGSGSIVNIVSVAAERGAIGRAPYAVAKAGLVALTKTAAVEWAARGVRVNAVGPGYVDTPLLRKAVSEGSVDLPEILRRIPVGKLGTVEHVAAVVSFLASSDATYVTGQVVYVDGGFLADYGVGIGKSGK